MLILLFTLVLIVLGVCTINLSSLNLTENERRLLYVSDGDEQADNEDFSLGQALAQTLLRKEKRIGSLTKDVIGTQKISKWKKRCEDVIGTQMISKWKKRCEDVIDTQKISKWKKRCEDVTDTQMILNSETKIEELLSLES